MPDQKNTSKSGDNSKTAQWRDNNGIVNLGGNNTYNGATVVGDNVTVTVNNDKKEK